jgi:hypothetical protein
MNISHIPRYILWMFSLLCLAFGLYWAFIHILLMFFPHNYLLAPLGDDAIDAVSKLYPIILKEKPISGIFGWYGDHRLTLARVQSLLEFFYTNGMQILQPVRLSLVLGADALLFIFYVLIPNQRLGKPIQALLATILLVFLFSSITIVNYGSSYMMTWPWMILFSSLLFIMTNAYYNALVNNASTGKCIFYILGMALLINMAIYTFSIGLMLWPIVFLVLIKRVFIFSNSKFSITSQKDAPATKISLAIFYRHSYQANILLQFSLLIILAILSYSFYFHEVFNFKIPLVQSLNMHPYQTTYLWSDFIYLTRMLTASFISSAVYTSSILGLLFGSFFFTIAVAAIYTFLMKKDWSNAESILFALLIFNFIAVIIIAFARGSAASEALSVNRFTTPAFMVLICIFTTAFLWLLATTKKKQFVLASLLVVYTLFFVKNDRHVWIYDFSPWNQFLIAESIGIPINATFGEAMSHVQNEADPVALSYLNTIQKNYHKGVYSLWMTPHVNHSIKELSFNQSTCQEQAEVNASILPPGEPPSSEFNTRFLTVTLNNAKNLSLRHIDILFTNVNGLIIGYGLSAPYIEPVFTWLLPTSSLMYHWKGAVNTELLKNSSHIIAWAVNKKEHKMCVLGTVKA